MLRSLLFALALLPLAPLAQAQSGSVVGDGEIVHTWDDVVGDGETFELDADRPTRFAMGAARRGQVRIGNSPSYRVVASSQQPQVRYRVRGEHSGDATPLLVRLAETDALRSLSTSGAPDGETFVDATFTFETVAEWAAWTERAATRALLAELSDGERGLRTDLDVTR